MKNQKSTDTPDPVLGDLLDKLEASEPPHSADSPPPEQQPLESKSSKSSQTQPTTSALPKKPRKRQTTEEAIKVIEQKEELLNEKLAVLNERKQQLQNRANEHIKAAQNNALEMLGSAVLGDAALLVLARKKLDPKADAYLSTLLTKLGI